MLNNIKSNTNIPKVAPKIRLTNRPNRQIPNLPQLLQISLPKLENKAVKMADIVIDRM